MRIARRILGVVVGYVIFAVSAVLLFRLSGHDPHAQQTVRFIVGSVVYGMVFAAFGGYVSAALGGGNPLVQGGAVGIIIALGAVVSLLAGPHAGALWSRLSALFLMAPSAPVGSIVRARFQGTAGKTG